MTERSETVVVDPVPGSVADLEGRIELLEDDVDYLCRAVTLASLREYELLRTLGIPDEAYHRDHAGLDALVNLLPSGPRTRN